ncbi:ring-cleaving dioxygenase [Agrobacterium vitis]|uniref:ring-cleaving dioxygenase n=1 Tax=Agrobacterium vitis TaxID=373 RepID=UPI000872B4B4|nr:ring-cleaving dioxygenase [Agrobacterium vitis]MCE6077796.1 ring-cleaving dioxygenase [Agrobacterium vitis]MCM2452551.1 ring-cleaving dioxygenase [Agrobacterium vitis]MCM2471420.1 ring-cleaving dioxygenase [Agrobacterium vitis]MUO72397.1 ring-cleaving dioxygenase [Agrobacterium vitis]MUO86382.1 ring-cleaving dioxygenase [Agrobacterium vitis]
MAHGIHHVTAIAGPARRNLDFYTRVLGQRFVKKTVNFDDPGTYHFYFGDEAGNPGTIMTFFPWEHAAPGRLGIGETQETGYRVPKASLGFWTHRFIEQGVVHEKLEQRFGQTVLPFKDPDGMRLALVGVEDIEHEAAWAAPGIPAEHALRGFHGVTLLLDKIDATAAVLTDVFGFEQQAKEGYVTRYHVPGTDIGGVVDLRAAGEFLPARPGAGSVHHVAFRAKDDAEQAEMAEKLRKNHGLQTTEQKDRDYFRSIYFRSPGGVLFEIATLDPGFAVDEPAETLGQALKLPKGLEGFRGRIEGMLPDISPLGETKQA